MYAVELDPPAEQQRDTLPPAGAAAYMELRALLEVSPWSGEPFREDKPDGNMLTQHFGDGHGMATYFVLEERRLVYVVSITWAG